MLEEKTSVKDTASENEHEEQKEKKKKLPTTKKIEKKYRISMTSTTNAQGKVTAPAKIIRLKGGYDCSINEIVDGGTEILSIIDQFDQSILSVPAYRVDEIIDENSIISEEEVDTNKKIKSADIFKADMFKKKSPPDEVSPE